MDILSLNEISLSQKMLNFDKETIKVVKGDTTNTIKVNGTLTIVGLANEFYLNCNIFSNFLNFIFC